MIRQHMEVGMVQRKLMEGGYAADAEFYRDLLLLCTNAVVFFPRTAMESVAAVELRRVVRKQVAAAIHRASSSSSAEEPIALHQTVAESDPDLPAAPPLVACRKRSSVASREGSKVAAAVEEETPPDSQKREAESVETGRTRERSMVAGLRRLRTNKGRGGSNGETRSSISRSALHSTEDDGTEKPAKAERNADNGVAVVKRRSAMNNLSTRTTERRHASSNGTLLETLKNSRKSLGSDPKKEGRGDDGRRDQGSRHASAPPSSSSGKQAPEQTAPVKRGVGRPPKRPAPAPAPTPLAPPAAKRPRGAQTEAAPPPPRAAPGRKRGRRK